MSFGARASHRFTRGAQPRCDTTFPCHNRWRRCEQGNVQPLPTTGGTMTRLTLLFLIAAFAVPGAAFAQAGPDRDPSTPRRAQRARRRRSRRGPQGTRDRGVLLVVRHRQAGRDRGVRVRARAGQHGPRRPVVVRHARDRRRPDPDRRRPRRLRRPLAAPAPPRRVAQPPQDSGGATTVAPPLRASRTGARGRSRGRRAPSGATESSAEHGARDRETPAEVAEQRHLGAGLRVDAARRARRRRSSPRRSTRPRGPSSRADARRSRSRPRTSARRASRGGPRRRGGRCRSRTGRSRDR